MGMDRWGWNRRRLQRVQPRQ